MQTFRKRMSRVPGVRPIALRLLGKLSNRNITIRHPVSGDPLRLNLFLHRGYWFHRATREESEIVVVSDILRDAEGTIVDIGANIGFLSLIYRALAPDADVIAVEPSPTNLLYLRQNAEPIGITVAPVALGSRPGQAVLFEDSLTGQNSSLVADFKVLAVNARHAGLAARTAEVPVQVTTLDALIESARRPVTFLKIDVEGFELEVLRGAQKLLAVQRPIIQVEVQREVEQTLGLLRMAGYRLFSSQPQQQLFSEEKTSEVFAVHADMGGFAHFVASAGRRGYREITLGT